MIKDKILKDLQKAVEGLGYKSTDIVCSISKNSSFGDYSTNVALQLSKVEGDSAKQNPIEIANQILEKLGTPDYLEKAEVAGNGFINFFVNPQILANDLQEILEKGKDFGKSDKGKGKKARVEFVSANPTGPLHIGNARGGPLGDTIASVLQSQGYEVLREYIHNDVGEQVKALGTTIKAKSQGNTTEENQYKGEYINELIGKIGSIEGKTDEEIGQMAVDLMYQEIMTDTKEMGIKFDFVVKESE